MKHRLYCIATVIVLLQGCSPADNKNTVEHAAALPDVENAADQGKALFEEKCSTCHGIDGSAGIANAANLQRSKADTLSIIKIISHGKNAMPAFSEQMSAGEIEQVANYVFTLRK